MGIFPLCPKDPKTRKEVQSVFKEEVKLYRRKPTFIIGISMWGISMLALIPITSGVLPMLLLLFSVFGAAFVHDTVIAHFSHRIVELKQKNEIIEKNSK